MIVINVKIPKELKKAVKVLAVVSGKTFKQVIIEALAEKVKRENEKD